MDKKNHNEWNPEDESFQDQLNEAREEEEIQPDAQARALDGFVTPDQAELDQLLAEAKAASGMDESEDAQSDHPIGEFRDEEYRDTFGEGEDLKRVFSDDPYEPNEYDENAPSEPDQMSLEDFSQASSENSGEEISLRKGRPKRKKGYGMFGIPHILATGIWLAIIVAIGVSLGRVAWVCAADVLAFGREDKVVSITIDDADTLDDIAKKLQEAGLIRYPGLFKAYGIFSNAREDISSGTFELNTIYDYHALVGEMNYYSSSRKIISVTIPEGYSCQQMFALLEEEGVCTAEKLETYAATGELKDYWFLEGVERGDKYSLEGFLFPDTYDFYVNDDAEHVLKKLLNNFENKFTDEMIEGIDTLNEKLAARLSANGMDETYIAEHKMDVRDVVTVASLIEKETANNDESFDIASVIYNRLSNPSEYPYLNIDAALLYVLGHKEALTTEDTQIDSPYNTYNHTGLVPGPITNPGLNSINAALTPNDTDYYFYALDTDSDSRVHHFTKTLAEHEAFLASLGD